MASRPTSPDVRHKYGALVDCIADLLGARAEVVLHDVSHPDHSIVMIRNGHVTGRSVGAPLTDLGFYMLRESDRKIETLGVYHSKTDTGKALKCNAVNLRDHKGKVEAILCINIDTASERTADGDGGSIGLAEHYQTSIEQVIRRMIADASAGSNGELTRQQKSQIVKALDQRGVFLARGALKEVASALKIAAPTVYKYIYQVRKQRAAKAKPVVSRKPSRPKTRSFRASA